MDSLGPILLPSRNREVLSELLSRESSQCPVIADFWAFMIACFNTPRPSTNYDGVDIPARNDLFREVCKKMCVQARLHYFEDQAGNIVIKNFNDGAMTAKFCFQGHMDVVVSRNEAVVHDFENDGVDVIIFGDEMIKPLKGITLGADNGVAIACGMAILKNNPSIPLELLITKNEETSFDGACGVDPNLISASTMLNLDSEVDRAICVGSAGGFEQHYILPLRRESTNLPNFEVFIRDLKGGHSGIDIDNERANAILVLARLLFTCGEDQILVSSIRGGTSSNAIPREASALIAANDEQIECLRKRFEDLQIELNLTEPNLRLEIVRVERADDVLSPANLESTRKLLSLIFALGSGVARKLSGCVESSYNLGVVSCDNERVSLRYLVRSSSVSWMKSFSNATSLVGTSLDAQVKEFQGFFGAWEPQYDSDIVRKLCASHPSRDGESIKRYTVHAGLECSTILERFAQVGRSIECASIGPRIENAHSPDECLYIDSAIEFVQWVQNVVSESL
jgi:dipeptidase D